MPGNVHYQVESNLKVQSQERDFYTRVHMHTPSYMHAQLQSSKLLSDLLNAKIVISGTTLYDQISDIKPNQLTLLETG